MAILQLYVQVIKRISEEGEKKKQSESLQEWSADLIVTQTRVLFVGQLIMGEWQR